MGSIILYFIFDGMFVIFVFRPTAITDGDVMVLTKPLGTQLATAAVQWLPSHPDGEHSENWQKCLKAGVTTDTVVDCFKAAVASMCRLNRTAARLMHRYEAHAATDVTGFGLLGHANNLLKFQRDSRVGFCLDRLPIIRNLCDIGRAVGGAAWTKLSTGRAVETSGGLLIAMPAKNAEAFCKDMFDEIDGGGGAWIVGRVVMGGNGECVMADDVQIIDV